MVRVQYDGYAYALPAFRKRGEGELERYAKGRGQRLHKFLPCWAHRRLSQELKLFKPGDDPDNDSRS